MANSNHRLLGERKSLASVETSLAGGRGRAGERRERENRDQVLQDCGRYVDFIPLAMRGFKLKSEVI